MRFLFLFQAVALTLCFSGVGVQSGSERVKQYDVILYEGAPPESYSEEARKELKPEKPLLTIRVEEGEKFHAEGNGAMFEGKILGVRGNEVEVRIERSHLGSTSASDFTRDVKLKEGFTSTLFGFSSIIRMYYFRVKSGSEDDGEKAVN